MNIYNMQIDVCHVIWTTIHVTTRPEVLKPKSGKDRQTDCRAEI